MAGGTLTTIRRELGQPIVVLIYFPNLTYHVATQDYTQTIGGASKTFYGLVERGGLGNVSAQAPEGINGISSTSVFTVKVIENGALVFNLLENSGNFLTGEAVQLWFKYDDGGTTEANAYKMFDGYVRDWSYSGDTVTINIEAQVFRKLADLLQSKVNDNYYPKQFGDFEWSTDPRFHAEKTQHTYAIAPLNAIAQPSGTMTFISSDHVMYSYPTAAQVGSYTTSASNLGNFYIFCRRYDRFCGIHCAPSNVAVTNSTASYMALSRASDVYYDISPTAEYAGAHASSPASNTANVFDGDSTTYCVTTGSTDSIYLDSFDVDSYGDLYEETSVQVIKVLIYFSNWSATPSNNFKVEWRDSSNVVQYETAANAFNSAPTGWLALSFSGLDDIIPGNVNNYFLRIRWTSGTATVRVHGVKTYMYGSRFKPGELDEECIYIRCQGKEYSGTWGSRKTSGNLITNPIDALESIVRDDWGITVDTDSFDNVSTLFSGCEINHSMFEQVTANNFLTDFAKAFNINIIGTALNTIAVSFADSGENFTFSGTTTAATYDIYTDSVTWELGAAKNVPIQKGSVKIKLNNAADVITHLDFKYRSFFDKEYQVIYSQGTGTPEKRLVVENRYMSVAADAQKIADYIHDWFNTPKLVINFNTFLDEYDLKCGNVINFDHTLLSTDLLGGQTIASTRWVIIGYQKALGKGTINVTAVQVPTAAAIATF